MAHIFLICARVLILSARSFKQIIEPGNVPSSSGDIVAESRDGVRVMCLVCVRNYALNAADAGITGLPGKDDVLIRVAAKEGRDQQICGQTVSVIWES